MRKLLVSTFSGGRTSAFMAKFLSNLLKYKDFDKVFIFANTGKEYPETLDFVKKCDTEMNLNIVWLEAKINYKKGIGTSYNIVNYETASRNGKPFEDMLKKYPLPSSFASNCTRELKIAPISKYVKSLGYEDVYTAMGIRYDEMHRISKTAEKDKVIYPLVNDIQVNYDFIRKWWDSQHFDLQLKDYQGNCDLCFKKSLKKRLTILKDNQKIGYWWQKIENKYGTDNVPRFDLRTNLSVSEQIELSKKRFTRSKDLHELSQQQCDLFHFETDCFCKAY